MNAPPCPPPSLAFHIGADVTWYGVSLWSVWVSYPVYVPSQDFDHPLLLVMGKHWRDRADAVLVLPRCGQSTSVSPAPFQPPMQSTGRAAVGKTP